MWSVKENGRYFAFPCLFQNLCLLFSIHLFSVQACETGLERTCVWINNEKTFLFWKMKSGTPDDYVELSECDFPNCGIGIIQSPWISPQASEIVRNISYKTYGTGNNYFRLNMLVDGASAAPRQLLSVNADYANPFPQTWTTAQIRIPPTSARYQLQLKGEVTYKKAMVAVKDINLNDRIIASSSTTTTVRSPAREDEESGNELNKAGLWRNQDDTGSNISPQWHLTAFLLLTFALC